MQKIVIITNLIPHYQIDFFNKLIDLDKNLELTVFADLTSKSPLNSYDKRKCNFKVINSPMKNIKGFILRTSLRKKIKKINPDYVVFYANPRELYLTLLMTYFKVSGREFYVHGMFHRIGGQTSFSNLYYKYMGFISSKCFTYSRRGASVLSDLGIKESKIKIIGTAINEEITINYSKKITDKELYDFKRENNILNKKVILQVVRLSEIKKPDIIIDVAKKMLSYRSDLKFVLIGDGEMYESIRAKVQSLKLNNSILLLGSIYDENVLSYWFKSADVFVMPTCIGLSAHHAFSYSLPIVTDDSLKNQASEFEILSEGLNSVLYKSGDIKSLEDSIIKVIDDDKFRDYLSMNALKTVTEVYSLKNKCLNYINSL